MEILHGSTIESKSIPRHKQVIYTRYVDAILAVIDTLNEFERLKNNYLVIYFLITYHIQNDTIQPPFKVLIYMTKLKDKGRQYNLVNHAKSYNYTDAVGSQTIMIYQ